MNGDPKLYELLNQLCIESQYIEHPEAPTIEIAKQYWEGHDARHCKNLFFRNHKGNKHYLVVFECHQQMAIHQIEKMLKQGKLSFASEQRMEKYLGLRPGSVSPFGLINDTEKHVKLFLDINLKDAPLLSFHPNDNTASLLISGKDMLKFIDLMQNNKEFLQLYQ